MKGNKKNLGQFFTPDDVVSEMVSLCGNKEGLVIEPSCGDGAFLKGMLVAFPGREIVGIEFDPKYASEASKITNFGNLTVINSDFLSFNDSSIAKATTIIGNPPYVARKETLPDTGAMMDAMGLSKKANLAYAFIFKCAKAMSKDAELIFIVPREFINATSAKTMNEYLFQNGTISHFFDLGDDNRFVDAAPNACIFRWQKGDMSRKTEINGKVIVDFKETNGILSFNNGTGLRFGDVFDIRVGNVSGANDVYYCHPFSNTDIVTSETERTGKSTKVVYKHLEGVKILSKHHDRLISRKIRKYDESNWTEWGRDLGVKSGKRIYVNTKTRNKTPFFTHSCENYDGSVLGLFPKKDIDINKAIAFLNSVDWNALGLKIGGRYCFGQRTLSEAIIPGLEQI